MNPINHKFNLALVSIFNLVMLLTTAEAKSLLTVSCSEPQGSNYAYGTGPFGTGMKMTTNKDGFKGVTPIFVIDQAKPDTMLVIFGDSNVLGAASQTKATDAVIVLETSEQISAVEPFPLGVWLYSFYPKLGIGYFSVHKTGLGGLSISSSYHSVCKFSR